jgi:hypothetical protein
MLQLEVLEELLGFVSILVIVVFFKTNIIRCLTYYIRETSLVFLSNDFHANLTTNRLDGSPASA